MGTSVPDCAILHLRKEFVVGNPNIFIFGYVGRDESVYCPRCWSKLWGIKVFQVILRSFHADAFKSGLKCGQCKEWIFFPHMPVDPRLAVFEEFIETLEF